MSGCPSGRRRTAPPGWMPMWSAVGWSTVPEDRAEALVLAAGAARAAADLGMGPLRADAEGLAGRLRGSAGRSGPPGLTRREGQIAALVARGLTNRQIADLLHVAERTAENHVQHILTKLGCQNRTQIAAWAMTQRLGDPWPGLTSPLD
jgi:DNA-binding NarL/FixJ family response regulator